MSNLLESQLLNERQHINDSADNDITSSSTSSSAAVVCMERIERSLAEIERLVNSCELMAKEIKSDARQILALCDLTPSQRQQDQRQLCNFSGNSSGGRMRRRWASNSTCKCQSSAGDEVMKPSHAPEPTLSMEEDSLTRWSATSPVIDGGSAGDEADCAGAITGCSGRLSELFENVKHQRAHSAPEQSFTCDRQEVWKCDKQQRISDTVGENVDNCGSEPDSQGDAVLRDSIKIETDLNSNILVDSKSLEIKNRNNSTSVNTDLALPRDGAVICSRTLTDSSEGCNHSYLLMQGSPKSHVNTLPNEEGSSVSKTDNQIEVQCSQASELLSEEEGSCSKPDTRTKESVNQSESESNRTVSASPETVIDESTRTEHQTATRSASSHLTSSKSDTALTEPHDVTSVCFYIGKEDNSNKEDNSRGAENSSELSSPDASGASVSKLTANNNIPKQESSYSFSELLDTVPSTLPSQLMSASTSNQQRKIKIFGNPRNRRTSEPEVIISSDVLTPNKSSPALTAANKGDKPYFSSSSSPSAAENGGDISVDVASATSKDIKKPYMRSQSDMTAVKLSSALAASAGFGGDSAAVSHKCLMLLFIILLLLCLVSMCLISICLVFLCLVFMCFCV